LPPLPNNDCAKLAELLKSPQRQLTNAENVLRTARCDGPASLQCVQAVKIIQVELADKSACISKRVGDDHGIRVASCPPLIVGSFCDLAEVSKWAANRLPAAPSPLAPSESN
jgi:hypothetical protein